jgi:hypothetical protein
MRKLWAFIESLSLTKKDRDWLVNKLTEPSPHQVNPYDISPSGDDFFADSRNVEAVQRDIDAAHRPDAKFTRLETKDDINALINSL